jgi:hypothetical protein
MGKCKGIVLGVLLAVSSGAIAGQSSDCQKDGDTVSLAGKVWRETFPDRPNYESIENGDEPETVWVLTLDSPRCVLGVSPDDNKPYEIGNITRFQLVLTPAQYKKHRAVLEHRAEIKGQLFQAMTGHHHTKALVEVKELKAVSAR